MPQTTDSPRILFLDIETFPLVAFTWQRYQVNVIDVKQESCIATFAAKWAGSKVFSRSLPDYKGYRAGSYDDRALVADLHKLLDEADIVVAHNGDAFDLKVIQGRFIFHGMCPPSPYKTIDTKKAAKKVGRFSSNKLDDLGKHLGEGKKIKTDFELWLGCMAGDAKAWEKMVRYNEQDVVLLEKVYLRLRPFMSPHPNLAAWADGDRCPRCGAGQLHKRGQVVTVGRRYQRYQCQTCGSWSRSLVSEGRALHQIL